MTVLVTTHYMDEAERCHRLAFLSRGHLIGVGTPQEITARFGDEYATRADYIDKYRHHYAFHPIHAILATHPLKRLRHAGRVFVAGAQDPKVPEHVGFIATPTVEDAIAAAEEVHGRDCSIVCVQQGAG